MSIAGRIAKRSDEAVVGARLPLLGKLKVGVKIKNARGVEFPQSIDYFRADGKYAAMFHQAYGEKPTKVEIVFFSNAVEDVCSEKYEIRDDAGRLMAEGDGENWRAWSPKDKDYKFGACSLEDMEKRYGKAKVVLVLRFLLPRIPSVWGMWQFSTKGVRSSIPQLRDTFDKVIEMAGFVTNIPFDLSVEKVKSNKPGVSSVFPVVQLVPNVSQENMDLLAEAVQQGQRLRGILTETRIRAIAATIDAEEIPALPALAAAPERAAEPAAVAPLDVPEREPGDDEEPEADLFGEGRVDGDAA